jgi:hypothetical protein
MPVPPSASGAAPFPAPRNRLERGAQALVRGVLRVPGARRVLLNPVIARPGYWFATLSGLLWGGILSLGRVRRAHGVIVARKLPRWSFGRGGTTIGAVYLTRDNTPQQVLEHEAVHRAQWKRYGLAFIPLYIAAGAIARTNRFEIEAGLDKGGYA